MRRTGPLIAAVLALSASVAGCGSLSARQCQAGEWDTVGRTDGEKGAAPDRQLERHRQACGKHGVTPDAAQYRAGHAAGLKAFCMPKGGYLAGRRGDGYEQQCPDDAEQPFLAAHRHGQRVWHIHRDVKELRRRAEDLEMTAMMEERSAEERTQLRFRAEEADNRALMRQWDLEHLDAKYAAEYGAPKLTWSEIRQR